MRANGDETMEFDFGAKAAPEVSPADVEHLVSVLSAEGRWMTAQKIADAVEGWTDRKVRAIAAAACPGVVSYPGSPGYKLWGSCTVEEIDHCIAAFETQAREMTKRAVLYRTAYHRRLRG